MAAAMKYIIAKPATLHGTEIILWEGQNAKRAMAALKAFNENTYLRVERFHNNAPTFNSFILEKSYEEKRN